MNEGQFELISMHHIKTSKPNLTKEESISRLKQLISETKSLVIGAGSGLSTSAGFEYGGKRFRQNFADFKEKYGIKDMYSGSFYNFQTPEERWAFMSRVIFINRYQDIPNSTYSDLFQLVQNKDYFVLTSNVDHCFQKAGFDKQRLFYTQGDYGLFQCSVPCTQKTFDNEEIISKMYNEQKDMKIPSQLLPKCPLCGTPMKTNLRGDKKFVEDDGWHQAAARYRNYLTEHLGKPLLFLELGVGYNTPGIIKYPFWKMTRNNDNTFFATINFRDAATEESIVDRSICIESDIGAVIKQLL